MAVSLRSICEAVYENRMDDRSQNYDSFGEYGSSYFEERDVYNTVREMAYENESDDEDYF